MAKNVTKPVKDEKKKHYVNPTETWWGKAVVWIIVFGMVGLIILSFILVLIGGNA